MTTVTIDDALANRLRTLRPVNGEENGDINALVADALAETVRRWERDAQGRAEMQAMLDGPRHSVAEAHARLRQKYGLADLSHLTDDELVDQAEQAIAAMDPAVRAEMEREGLL